MIPLSNGFYLFPLSCAVNWNRLIFDPSEVEIHQYMHMFNMSTYWINSSKAVVGVDPPESARSKEILLDNLFYFL